MVSRHFYWVFLTVGTVLAAMLIYRTELISIVSPVQAFSIAEFGGVSLIVEHAATDAAREKGLGGRVSVADRYGMLFVFPEDDFHGFWMKDTLVPLDIFWLDDKGHVVSIAESVATSSYPHVFYPSVPARYVLETVAGFAREHRIATGTPLLLKNLTRVSE